MLRVRTTLSGWTGGPGLMTHYFVCTTEDAAAAIRCQNYVQGLFSGALRLMLFNGVAWTVQPEVDEITSADGYTVNTFVNGTARTGSGTAGASESPPVVMALLRWATATWLAGKHLRGHSFVGPLATAATDTTGTLDNSILSGANAAITSWLAGFTSGDNLVVWHRPKNHAGGATGVVVSGALQDKLAFLRSRRD